MVFILLLPYPIYVMRSIPEGAYNLSTHAFPVRIIHCMHCMKSHVGVTNIHGDCQY